MSSARDAALGLIKSDTGYIVASEVERFVIYRRPGSDEDLKIVATLKSGRIVHTGLYEDQFLDQWAACKRASELTGSVR